MPRRGCWPRWKSATTGWQAVPSHRPAAPTAAIRPLAPLLAANPPSEGSAPGRTQFAAGSLPPSAGGLDTWTEGHSLTAHGGRLVPGRLAGQYRYDVPATAHP